MQSQQQQFQTSKIALSSNHEQRVAQKRRGRGREKSLFKQQKAHQRSRSRSRSRGRKGREDASSSENGLNEDQSKDGHSNSYHSQSQQDIVCEIPPKNAEDQEFENAIRSIIVEFFFSCKYDKGFVFTSQERAKLIKEEQRLIKKQKDHKSIGWKKEHKWNPSTETQKVQKIFQKNSLNLPGEKVSSLKIIFRQSSCMFADQATEEFYSLLFEILKLAKQVRPQRQHEEVKLLMNETINDRQKWRFFSFGFSSYFKPKLDKCHQQKVYQGFGQQLLAILKQKL